MSKMTMETTDTGHAVYARTADGSRVRVSDPTDSWAHAQGEWSRLDGLRRARRFPHVRHFEVRSTDDPGYAGAPLSFTHLTPVTPRARGFASYHAAARAAWKLWQGAVTRDGKTQGVGGWYYWHSGKTAAQGLRGPHGLEGLVRRRGSLVVQGDDGRYYPLVEVLS